MVSLPLFYDVHLLHTCIRHLLFIYSIWVLSGLNLI